MIQNKVIPKSTRLSLTLSSTLSSDETSSGQWEPLQAAIVWMSTYVKVRRPKSIIFLVFTLFLTFSCAHKSPSRLPILPHLSDPEQFLNEVLRNADIQNNVSGIAKLKFSSLGKKMTARYIFFAKHPYFFRFEMLSFFNQPILFFVSDGHKVKLYLPSENSLYVGDATEENLAAVIGVSFPPADVVRAFLGYTPAFDLPGSNISWKQDNSLYFFDISSQNISRFLWVDPEINRIIRYMLFETDELKYELSFSDFKYTEGLLFPSKVDIVFHPNQSKITFEYQSLNTDPVSMAMFTFTPPSQAKLFPFKDFLDNNP